MICMTRFLILQHKIKSKFISSKKLNALIDKKHLDKAQALTLTVETPAPGGGVSGKLSLTVKNPTPKIRAINPDDILAEGDAFDMTVTGSDFVKGESKIFINELAVSTRYISNSKLEGKVPFKLIQTAGGLPVKVRTSKPGGGESGIVILKITYRIKSLIGGKASSFLGDGGKAANALLSKPSGVAIDNRGNVYIADTGNSRIRKIDANTGKVSTIAGTKLRSYLGDGGQARKASLKYPADVQVDRLGNVFIADTENHSIRKIDRATGNITTIIGIGRPGFDKETTANKTRLNAPVSLALDSRGNIYVVDSGNGRVRKVDIRNNTISTIAGTGMTGYKGVGKATKVNLDEPAGIAVDRRSFIYIAARGSNHIFRVNP